MLAVFVKYYLYHSQIKCTPSRCRVIFFLLYRQKSKYANENYAIIKLLAIIRRQSLGHDVIDRGYYTVARRYEFYVRVARTISHEWAKQTSEILFLPREHKIHIFEPTFNVLFIIWRLKQKAGIVTSLNDTTLTKVTYGKYATRVPDEVAYGIYEWFSSQ